LFCYDDDDDDDEDSNNQYKIYVTRYITHFFWFLTTQKNISSTFIPKATSFVGH